MTTLDRMQSSIDQANVNQANANAARQANTGAIISGVGNMASAVIGSGALNSSNKKKTKAKTS